MTDKIVVMLRLSECPKSLRLKPTEDTYGYRWVYSALRVYLVRIKVNGEYCKNIFARDDDGKEYEYLTEDWTIDEIRDAMTNKIVDRIDGPISSYYASDIDYTVGNHIVGEPVFFCISIDDFKKNQMAIMKYICNRVIEARSRIHFSR